MSRELIAIQIKKFQLAPLRDKGEESSAAEIHDDLGGLFETQDFMGPAADSKTSLEETLSWFEIPQNIETLFNVQQNRSTLSEARKDLGFRIWWQRRSELKQLEKTLKAFTKLLKSQKILPQLLASHYMRRSLNPLIMEFVDLKTVCQFLSGQIDAGKLQASISGGNALNPEQIKSLEKLRSQIKEQVSKSDSADALKLLVDIGRYRQQLKY